MLTKNYISSQFRELQLDICKKIQTLDSVEFIEDTWTRDEGGGGHSNVLVDGDILAKAGVNFSAVHGKTPKKILDALNLDDADFFATGVSIVMHPINPFVPIIHMNVRYFEMSDGTYWFGGGIDVTPHYIQKDDAREFHQTLKNICDECSPEYYHKFKKWADDYFYLPHRNETRGIGGIFFDRLNEQSEDITKEKLFEFVYKLGSSFAPIYTSLIQKNKDKPYSKEEIDWQSLRRSRYVEFNLLHDKGTKFGLDTNGRTESILMSMPPVANWKYNYKPTLNSKEANTQDLLKKEIDWIND